MPGLDQRAIEVRIGVANRGDAAPFATNNSYGLLAMGADADPLDPAKAIPAISGDMATGNYASAIARATPSSPAAASA